MNIFDLWKIITLNEAFFFELINKHNAKFDLNKPEDYIFASGIEKTPHLNNISNLLKFSDCKFDAYVGWGLNKNTRKIFRKAVFNDKPFFMAEDGFIRSIFSYATDNVDNELQVGVSFTLSSDAFYFVGDRETSLERLLNDFEVTEEQKYIARLAIDKIIRTKVSKYNNQPLKLEKIGTTNKEKILVIDQSYGDASLKYGLVDDNVFSKMIYDAVNDNPESEILFKIHPDNIARCNSKYSKMLPENVTIIDEYVNPLVLMEFVKKVYVATSQLGFEALLLGKEVNVYGMPFYSNWGLTNDYLRCKRRKRTLSIEEMFYIVYIVYSRYVNPKLGKVINIFEAIDYICELRDSYFKNK